MWANDFIREVVSLEGYGIFINVTLPGDLNREVMVRCLNRHISKPECTVYMEYLFTCQLLEFRASVKYLTSIKHRSLQGIANYRGLIPVAVKTLSSRATHMLEKFVQETNLMKKFCHPNIVSLLGNRFNSC